MSSTSIPAKKVLFFITDQELLHSYSYWTLRRLTLRYIPSVGVYEYYASPDAGDFSSATMASIEWHLFITTLADVQANQRLIEQFIQNNPNIKGVALYGHSQSSFPTIRNVDYIPKPSSHNEWLQMMHGLLMP